MNDNTRTEKGSALDRVVARNLASRYGNLTRRGFFSMATRKLVGLTGVALGVQMLPYLAEVARADNYCGLHGTLCGGACTAPTQGIFWVACCPTDTCPVSYTFCTYTDYCAANPIAGCVGSGHTWCNPDTLAYVCTMVGCAGTYSNPNCTL